MKKTSKTSQGSDYNYGPKSKGACCAPAAPNKDQSDMIKTLLELPGNKPRTRAYN